MLPVDILVPLVCFCGICPILYAAHTTRLHSLMYITYNKPVVMILALKLPILKSTCHVKMEIEVVLGEMKRHAPHFWPRGMLPSSKCCSSPEYYFLIYSVILDSQPQGPWPKILFMKITQQKQLDCSNAGPTGVQYLTPSKPFSSSSFLISLSRSSGIPSSGP